jgi:hypothetical protein
MGCARCLQDTGSDAGPCETGHYGCVVWIGQAGRMGLVRLVATYI